MQKLSFALIALLAAAAASAAPVGMAVARAVAEEQVASFFPGEAWRLADEVAAVDGDGNAAAYGFVFVLSDGSYAADGAVRAAVAAGELGDDGESPLYAETATVVTGANDTDSLVFRTFRGLADWYGAWASADGAGTVVRLGAGDIRFAAEGAAASRSLGGRSRAAKALQAEARSRTAARAAEKEALPEDLKALADEAEAEAAAAAKARWGAAAEAQKATARAAALKAAGLAE
jgi:hypothetical protein